MKKVIISLFAAYQLTSAQGPPGNLVPSPRQTTAVPLPPGVVPIPGGPFDTTLAPQAPATTLAQSPQTTAVQTPATTAAAPATTAAAVPVVTVPQTPATTAAAIPAIPVVTAPQTPATTARPVTTSATLPPGQVIPEIPAIPAIPAPVPAGPFPPVNPSPMPEPIPLQPTAPSAPDGYVFGAFEQLCPVPDANRDYVCRSPADMGSDLLPGQSPGFLKCERGYDCCTCSSLLCQDCNTFSVGPSGAYGVKDIVINGREAQLGGASIKCQATESCLHTVMNTQIVKDLECMGDMSCMGSTIRVFDPVLPGFKMDCTGTASCDSMTLEVIIPGPPSGYACNPDAPKETVRINALDCNGPESCRNAEINVINNGCDHIIIDDLKCFGSDACLGTKFNFVGDIELGNCDLGPSGHSATGIDKCFEGLLQLKCPDPHSCSGSVKTLVNPTQSFQLHCGNTGACENSQFTLMFDLLGEEVTTIEGFVFSSENAGRMATITVQNQQYNGKTLDIEKIECKAKNSCAGTTFVLGHDVSIWEMQCGPRSCGGCRVKINPMDEGVPCDPKQLEIPVERTPTLPPIATAPAPTPRPTIPRWLPAV